jgi:hypothetical protein
VRRFSRPECVNSRWWPRPAMVTVLLTAAGTSHSWGGVLVPGVGWSSPVARLTFAAQAGGQCTASGPRACRESGGPRCTRIVPTTCSVACNCGR